MFSQRELCLFIRITASLEKIIIHNFQEFLDTWFKVDPGIKPEYHCTCHKGVYGSQDPSPSYVRLSEAPTFYSLVSKWN